MEKKSTSKASKASKNTKASATLAGKTAKKVTEKVVMFAGKVARKSTFKTSKWSKVPGTTRKFTKEELKAIHSVRIFQATDKEGNDYWFIKVLFREEKELWEVSFSPDLRLIDEAEHGDYIDPAKFGWYKLTDGEKVIEKAYGVIIDREEDDEEEEYDTPY